MSICRRLAIGALLVVALAFPLFAQEHFCVMEYNVENLFDCRHDTLKQDMEFLPSSVRGWNSFRFYKKINHLGQVILAASTEDVPDIVGLAEVENDFCMKTLTRFSPLRELRYEYVMTDSPDERGIDVAIMYQPMTFKYLKHESFRIPPLEYHRPTRDLLHLSGKIVSGDTLDVFMVHFPSRSGGEKASESYRLRAAEVLKSKVDSIARCRAVPLIVVMGDFNDYSSNRSVKDVLCASTLVDLTVGLPDKGTYKYKGEWNFLDHVLVNRGLCSSVQSYACEVLRLPFLLQEDEEYGGEQPWRTYRGMRYWGGYSDHLPLRATLVWK